MRSANLYGRLPYHNIRKKRNKKIILIISEFFPTKKEGDITGGVEASMFFLAQDLSKEFNVHVLSSFMPGSRDMDTMYGFTIHRAGSKRDSVSGGLEMSRLFYILDAIWYGRGINADIVIGTNFITHTIAYIIGHSKKIPIVFWVPDVWRGDWIKYMGIEGLFGELIEWFNHSHKDVSYIAISQSVKRKIIHQGIARNRVSVVYCGVQREAITRLKVKKDKLPTLCMISRLVKYKRIDVVLKALSIIEHTIPDVRLKIVGQGPEKPHLLELIKRLKLNKKVILTGYMRRHEDVLRQLKSSDVFVSSSNTEGFGIVTVEAMTAGIPYVISDTEVNREITGSMGGLFFEPDNPQNCAKKIIILLTNKTIYKKARVQGLEYSKKYDSKEIAKEFKKFISQTLY